MNRTPICGFPKFPATICGFLWFPGLQHSRTSRQWWGSAKLRFNSGAHAVPVGLFPQVRPDIAHPCVCLSAHASLAVCRHGIGREEWAQAHEELAMSGGICQTSPGCGRCKELILRILASLALLSIFPSPIMNGLSTLIALSILIWGEVLSSGMRCE